MPSKKMFKKHAGRWSFIIGVLMAIIIGMFQGRVSGAISAVLVVLGLIIGLMNIQEKEQKEFLIATVALMLTGSAGLGTIPKAGFYIAPMLTNLVILVAPAAVIVSLQSLYDLARD